MKQLLVECKPDELLVSKLGYTRKNLTHYQGKSRIFNKLKNSNDLIAMVDEDPGSIKTSYENTLQFVEEAEGISQFSDGAGNKVLVLKGKLEDWILDVCKRYKAKPADFGLPEKPNELHGEINHKLSHLGKLIDHLIKRKNPALLKLKSLLN